MRICNTSFFSKEYNIVIYGCGSAAKRIVRWMKNQNMQIYMCVDSNKSKKGLLFMDEFLIQTPDALSDNSNNHHIIVTPDRNREIFELLNSYGYTYREDYIDYNDILNYWSELLVSYIQKQRYKTKFIFAPKLNKMLNCSNIEKSLLNLNMPERLLDRLTWLLSFPPHIKECYKNLDYFSEEYLNNIFTGSEVLDLNGTYIQKDIQSKYVNVLNGMRVTTDQPEYYEHVIHFFGNSYVYGFGVEDKYTLPSCLQRKFNNKAYNYIVLNQGIRGLTFELYMNQIKNANIKNDDYVLLYFEDEPFIKEALMMRSVPYIDMTEFLIRKRNEEIFFDWGSHLNYKGNLIVADKLFELFCSEYTKMPIYGQEFGGGVQKQENLSLWINNPDFQDYITILQEIRDSNNSSSNDVIGGIVMNCNPFTFGHQHLIQIASQMVDKLYIFVVSENRSEFDFEDRIQMVKNGTQHIPNVIVIPSGKFILSAVTFPEYFSKDEQKYVKIDMSNDIEIFGSVIAKELGITIRFVGEEPIDVVTRQYNDSMKRILPKYNIKLLEIPRIKSGNKYISASIVRKLWHNGELQKLKKYVPECTYNYLITKC